MEIKKLTPSFYEENTHLEEVLDKKGLQWDSVKKRGYGIVVINILENKFGIPLRSNLKHKDSFPTAENESGYKKGLDFSKAVLLLKDSYISDLPFMIPNDEYAKIKEKSYFITSKFEKYVHLYIQAVQSGDPNKLRRFQFSTLRNYHAELNLL